MLLLRYLDINVGTPTIAEDVDDLRVLTPHQARLRDLNYSAPIFVDIEFTRGKQIVIKKEVEIGR